MSCSRGSPRDLLAPFLGRLIKPRCVDLVLRTLSVGSSLRGRWFFGLSCQSPVKTTTVPEPEGAARRRALPKVGLKTMSSPIGLISERVYDAYLQRTNFPASKHNVADLILFPPSSQKWQQRVQRLANDFHLQTCPELVSLAQGDGAGFVPVAPSQRNWPSPGMAAITCPTASSPAFSRA